MRSKEIGFICFCLSLCFGYTTQAQGKPAYFIGHLRSNSDSVRLKVSFLPNEITGFGNNENIAVKVYQGRNGQFSFTLPTFRHPARIVCYNELTGNKLFDERNIVEPGDSVQMLDVSDNRNGLTNYIVASFEGKGSIKYTCAQALRKLGAVSDVIAPCNTPVLCIQVADSIWKERQRVLDGYRQYLNGQAYEMMKADLTGEIGLNVLSNIYGKTLYRLMDAVPDSGVRQSPVYLKHFVDEGEKQNFSRFAAMSVLYIQYFYSKDKLELALSSRNGSFGFKDLYYKLSGESSGILRDKLLAYYFADPFLLGTFDQISAEDFTFCLNDAANTIKTPWIKSFVGTLLRNKGKGASAFDFVLPVDSSDRKLRLSDLKGKVLLIDFWAYTCTGCTEFAQAFHKKVFPLFKNNPNFRVVSIMASVSTKAHYMERLRGNIDKYGAGLSTYTYPDYINLFGGEGVKMGRELCAHYNIDVFPYILLIDGKGRIYSSTVPFFTSPDSPNTEELASLINGALQQ